MKKTIYVLALVALQACNKTALPIEKDAYLTDGMKSGALLNSAIDAVLAQGFPCNTISMARQETDKPGAMVYCDGDKYRYGLIPTGGTWVVYKLPNGR